MEDRQVRKMVNDMIDEENPPPTAGTAGRCVCCGKELDNEANNVLRFCSWLDDILWTCPECDRWLEQQTDPQLAFQLSLIKRAQKRG